MESETKIKESKKKYLQKRRLLLVCDTKLALELENESPLKDGGYRNSFYPLRNAINKIIEYNKSKNTSYSVINDYLKEDEYIMRLIPTDCHILKWNSLPGTRSL